MLDKFNCNIDQFELIAFQYENNLSQLIWLYHKYNFEPISFCLILFINSLSFLFIFYLSIKVYYMVNFVLFVIFEFFIFLDNLY